MGEVYAKYRGVAQLPSWAPAWWADREPSNCGAKDPKDRAKHRERGWIWTHNTILDSVLVTCKWCEDGRKRRQDKALHVKSTWPFGQVRDG